MSLQKTMIHACCMNGRGQAWALLRDLAVDHSKDPLNGKTGLLNRVIIDTVLEHFGWRNTFLLFLIGHDGQQMDFMDIRQSHLVVQKLMLFAGWKEAFGGSGALGN